MLDYVENAICFAVDVMLSVSDALMTNALVVKILCCMKFFEIILAEN